MKTKGLPTILIKNMLVAVIAFQVAFYFTTLFDKPTFPVGALWAVISAYLVLEDTPSEAYMAAKNRMIGTFIGAFVSGIYFYFSPFTLFGYVVAIGIGVVVCFLFKRPQSVRLCGITISVILIAAAISKDLHPVINAALRFAESAIGAGAAILVTLLVFYVETAFTPKTNKEKP